MQRTHQCLTPIVFRKRWLLCAHNSDCFGVLQKKLCRHLRFETLFPICIIHSHSTGKMCETLLLDCTLVGSLHVSEQSHSRGLLLMLNIVQRSCLFSGSAFLLGQWRRRPLIVHHETWSRMILCYNNIMNSDIDWFDFRFLDFSFWFWLSLTWPI